MLNVRAVRGSRFTNWHRAVFFFGVEGAGFRVTGRR